MTYDISNTQMVGLESRLPYAKQGNLISFCLSIPNLRFTETKLKIYSPFGKYAERAKWLHCNETGPKKTTATSSVYCHLTIGTTGPELMYLTRSQKNGFEDNAA